MTAGHGPTEVSSSTVIAPAVITTIALGYRPIHSVSAHSSIDEVTDLLAAHDNSHLFPPEHGHLQLGTALPPIVHAIAASRGCGTAGIYITTIAEPPPPLYARGSSEAAIDLRLLSGGVLVRDADAPTGIPPALSICVSLPTVTFGVRPGTHFPGWLRPPPPAVEYGRHDQ